MVSRNYEDSLSMAVLWLMVLTFVCFGGCGSREVEKAKQYMDAGMYTQAIELLKLEVMANPKDAEAHFLLGKCYLMSNDHREARASFRRAILLRTNYQDRIGDTYLEIAERLLLEKNLRQAESYIEDAIAANSLTRESAIRTTIRIAKQWPPDAGLVDTLVRIFSRVPQQAPSLQAEAARECIRIAERYSDNGMHEEAGRLLDVAIDLDPNKGDEAARVFWKMGVSVLSSLGDVNTGIGFLDKCVRFSSKRREDAADLCFEAHQKYDKNGQTGAARTLITKARDLDPKYIKKAEEYYGKFRSPPEATNSVGMEFKLIMPGAFLMGTPDRRSRAEGDEFPQHRIELTRPFYMAVTEVTQAQWARVMNTQPWMGKSFTQQGDDYPVAYVNWHDALEFCEKLGQMEGRRYRLPTEAEWEYACRAGTQTEFSFGDAENTLGDYAWYLGNCTGESYPHRVAQKMPNPWGLYDMHGNLWEWCQDNYSAGYYSVSPNVDPQGPSEGTSRIIRGGSWDVEAWHCRSADRGPPLPNSRHQAYGFRVVLEAD